MKKFFVLFLICLLTFTFAPKVNFAQSANDLQQMIVDTQKQRDALLEQQKKLQAELEAIGQHKDTLQTNIKALDTTKTKLTNDIKITQSKITTANLSIQSLQNSVNDKQNQVSIHEKAISTAIKQLAGYDSDSIVMNMLNDKNISEMWTERDTLEGLQNNLLSEISKLQQAQEMLKQKKEEKEKAKEQLVGLKTELGGQKTVVETTQAEKTKLLVQTQGQETIYQKMLADNIALEKKFEEQQYLYESQLKVTLDPSAIPSSKRGVLVWPLSSITITQYFGYTPEAAKLYKTTARHGGMDFRASIGTPVFAALAGTVTDTENYKTKKGCQYGKWVLIKHDNGLSTIYGHFSSVLVNPGQTVQTGQIIGYSGNTGYATGPHLHFGLYATAGVRIVDASTLGSSNCTGIKTVAAPLQAYLDPLAYLPPLN